MGNTLSNCYQKFYQYDNVIPVVVTDASGHVGRAVVESLINDVRVRGHVLEVFAASRYPDDLAIDRSFSKRTERKLGGKLLCDAANPVTLQDCFADKRVAVIIPPTSSDRAERTYQMVEAAYSAGVRFLVMPSTLSVRVDRERTTALAGEFADLEDRVRTIGISYCFVRLPPVMELLLAQASSIRDDGAFTYPMSPNTRMTDVSVADAGALIAGIISKEYLHKNATYNITGSEAVSHSEMAEMLSNILGREIRYTETTSPEQARQVFSGIGREDWEVDGMIELCKLAERGALDIHSNDFAHIVGREAETKQEWAMRNASELSDASLPPQDV